MINYVRKFQYLDKLLLFLVPLLLVIIWFHSENILGSGESGLPFYNFNIQKNDLSFAWGKGGLGLNVGITIATKPTFLLFAFLQQLGLKGFLLQAAVFYTLLVIAGVSIYYLVKKIFPNLSGKYDLLAVFFYWFNPISTINVWNRFLYNYMFFWAELPLIFLLVYQLLKTRKWLYVLLLNCTFILFSYVQTSVPFIVLSWALVLFCFLFSFLIDKKDGKIFYIKSLLVLGLVYILTNLWWITQLFSFLYSSNFITTTSLFFTTNGNLDELTSLSNVLGMFSYVFRYYHSGFIGSGPIWARVFSFPPLIIFEFVPTLIIFWTVYKFRQAKEVLFLGLLFFLTLFFIKGNQAPFGEIFQLFFVKFSFLQVFRNPFEKFGLLLPLFGAPLFAYGLSSLVKYTQRKILKRVFFGLSLFVLLILWGFPFWTGLVFTSTNDTNPDILRSYETKVPDYYNQANNWLNAQGNNFRFISLPLGGEGMTYSWDQPYSGVELSSTLFDTPNISFNTSVPYYQEIASTIEKNLLTNNKFLDQLSLLNVKFLVLRNDIDWKVRAMRDPKIIEQKISLQPEIKKAAQFGNLTIYSIPSDKFEEKIYASDSNIEVEPVMRIEDFSLVGASKSATLYTGNDQVTPNTILINPTQMTFYQKGAQFSEKEALSRLLYSRYLPGSLFYTLIRLRESIDRMFTTATAQDRFIFDLTHLGKRVAEAHNLLEKGGQTKDVDKVLENYQQDLRLVTQTYAGQFTDASSTNRAMSQEEFSKQLVVLNGIKDRLAGKDTSIIDQVINELKNDMLGFGFITRYPIQIDSIANKYWVYYFNVRKDGEYDTFSNANRINDFYAISPDIKLQIDSNVVSRRLTSSGPLINLGKVNLNQGTHEIVLAEPPSFNLVQSENEIDLSSGSNDRVLFQVLPFDPFSTYEVSYDYWIRKGGTFHLTVADDNDINNSLASKNDARTINNDGYKHDFIHDQVIVGPKNGSNKLYIGFTVDPYNTCIKEKTIFPNNCNDIEYKKNFDQETQVVIRNLIVKKVFNNSLTLVKKISDQKAVTPLITFSQVNPSQYRVFVSGANGPYLLVLSELYNSGWQLKFDNGQKVDDKNHLLVNAYANGWLVDRTGSYHITIEFAPQKILDLGSEISEISVGVLLIVTLIFLVKSRL